jgi:NADPH2:quinone reductase
MRVLEMTQPGDPDVLRVAKREVPVPGPGKVLVRVAYAGLNFTDVLARRGAPGYASQWPFVPGMEIAGTVAEGAEGFSSGEQVVAFTPDGGGYAEYAVADARLTVAVPGLDLAAATTIPLTWATALGLVRRSHAGPGDAVLVTSAGGGVGAALAAVLARHDVRVVVGGVGSAAKLAELRAGVRPVVRDEAFYADAVAAAGSEFDVILDSVGGDVLREAAAHLAIEGRLVSYGAAAGQPDPETPAFGGLRAGNQTISGFSILRLARTAPEKVRTLIRDAADLPLTPPTIVGWDQLIDAHVRQSNGLAIGKTVVAVGSGLTMISAD